MNSLEKRLIEQASKLMHDADGDWNYWVHSTDYALWKKLFFCGPTALLQLAGRQLLVDDTSPLFFKNHMFVHDEMSIELDARAMVLHGLHRSLLERVKKPKSLATYLHEELVGKQRNALIPEDFHWYLNQLTISNLQKENAGVLDAGLKMLHPDDTTYRLNGYRVRTDPDAPAGSHVDIVQHSLEMTNNDHDWYAMWARRWKVDRKMAKYALCLYVYGPQQAGEKEIIKTHYDNIVAGGKEQDVVGVGPWSYVPPVGRAKDVLKEKGVELLGERPWRRSIDEHWEAVGDPRSRQHDSYMIVLQYLQRVTESIEAGHRDTAIKRINQLMTSVITHMVKR
jgi:hypothetical protein